MRSTTQEEMLAPSGRQLELAIGGMTCASCPPRIERKLRKLDAQAAQARRGVRQGNVTTARVQVIAPAQVTVDEIVRVMEDVGYPAEVHTTALRAATDSDTDRDTAAGAEDAYDEHTRALRRRILGSVLLATPVVVLSMVPALRFPHWQWLALALAGPVAVWGAWPFHKGAGSTPVTAPPPWTPLCHWGCSRRSGATSISTARR